MSHPYIDTVKDLCTVCRREQGPVTAQHLSDTTFEALWKVLKNLETARKAGFALPDSGGKWAPTAEGWDLATS